jgi:hypothetical protein
MKKIVYLLIIISVTFTMACKKNTEKMIVGNWMVVQAEMKDSSREMTDEEKEIYKKASEVFIGQIWVYNEDQTYKLGESNSGGTYRLSEDGKTLYTAGEYGEMDQQISEISDTKLVLTSTSKSNFVTTYTLAREK